jgi:hypothetical protein
MEYDTGHIASPLVLHVQMSNLKCKQSDLWLYKFPFQTFSALYRDSKSDIPNYRNFGHYRRACSRGQCQFLTTYSAE